MDPVTAQVLVAGAQLGMKGLLAYSEYMTRLYAKQQTREAEGKPFTMADVHELLDETHATVVSNRESLDAKQAAFDAS